MPRAAAPAPAPQLRPPLKWAGGKRWQLPVLQRLWRGNEERRLVEPCCGGLSVALGLRPRRALLNDANPHLINFYRRLQRGLVSQLRMENRSGIYYSYRQRFNTLAAAGQTDGDEAASLFYYLNRTGFNGLCRFNSRGEFNVPFGRYERIVYRRDFSMYAPILSQWAFSALDFQDLRLDPDDFVYADPPYDVPFTQYARSTFKWDDQVRLARWLADHRGPVVLANQVTPRVETLYRGLGFTLRRYAAPRMISCNGDRRRARELLAIRNL